MTKNFYVTFDSSTIPKHLQKGTFSVEYCDRHAGSERADNPEQKYTGWFLTHHEEDGYWAQVTQNSKTFWINLQSE